MALKSALEDFESTTLGAVPGLLGKLHYIARLHDGHGRYAHWGMGRVHGEEAARRAIRTAHTALLTQILRSPLRVLAEDLKCSASGSQTAVGDLLSFLGEARVQALPDRAVAASEKHFTAVLHALSALVANQARATLPDA